MAQYTRIIQLHSKWTVISAGKGTCLITCLNLGTVELAVVDGVADINDLAGGHTINYAKNPDPVTLTGLGNKTVVAKTNADGNGQVNIAVTAY